MGTENTSSANTPPRPVATPFAAPQSTPFSSSRPVAGPAASAFRPTPALAPQTAMPLSSSGPVVGSEASGCRPMPPGRYSGPSVPPPPSSYGPTAGGPFHRFPTPQFLSTTQAPPRTLPVGQPVLPSHPAGQVSSMTAHSLHKSTAPDSISADGIPTSKHKPNLQPSSPPMGPSYPAARGTFQPALPGYPGRLCTPPPPLGAPQGFYPRGQIQPPGSAPPTGAVQGLTEDFSSLSFGSVPGSFDPGFDSKALPRPLEEPLTDPNPAAEDYDQPAARRIHRLALHLNPPQGLHNPGDLCMMACAAKGKQLDVSTQELMQC
ncbi:hypothetical protein RJ639_002886 [Escallonia herrerae]|uniref:Uncharacterized protein n=1 Tax=Escallonia herrerae TaxID=1293975 RepID=A0AA89AXI1_9ASTE|nr:hypothetical protein RJ639_002886 [Escallonia herrerae]